MAQRLSIRVHKVKALGVHVHDRYEDMYDYIDICTIFADYSRERWLNGNFPLKLDLLKALGEEEYQRMLSEDVLELPLDYVDTHASPKDTPSFLLAIDKDPNGGTYDRSGKPDLQSTHLPLLLEMKSNSKRDQQQSSEVLLQSLDRIATYERMYCFLRRAFCIAVTGKDFFSFI